MIPILPMNKLRYIVIKELVPQLVSGKTDSKRCSMAAASANDNSTHLPLGNTGMTFTKSRM